MSHTLPRVAARIQEGLVDLAQAVERAQSAWRKAQLFSDDLYLDSLALNLHAFYTGLERLFELIAAAVDGDVPQGSNWHQQLLEQMTREVPGVRPAVISRDTYSHLEDYRGFRHVVRNVYAFRFDPQKLEMLIGRAQSVYSQVEAELSAFARLLDR